MPTPLLKRIYQLPSLTTPVTQLAGGYLVWDVPLGPVPGGYKSYKGTAEELAAYLRAQGLLVSETAALLTADAATGVLTYEAPKNLSPADVLALGFAITTASGTTHELLVNITSVYDSGTGELLITLPTTIAAADVLSVHLYRPAAGGQEQVLAADIYPFGGGGGGGGQFLTGTYTIQAADLPEPRITVPDAVVFASVGIEGTNGSLNPLAYNVGYASSGNVLTTLAAANAQAGEVVHYSYLAGSVAAGYGDTQAKAAAAAALVAGNPQHQGVQASVVGGQVVLVVGVTAVIRFRIPAPGAGNVATDGMDYRDADRQGLYKLQNVVNVANLKIVKQGPTTQFDGPPSSFPAAGLLLENNWYTYTFTPTNVNQPMAAELVAAI